MMKALIWNIRSVKSQKSFQRVQMLHNFYTFGFLALLEPFLHVRTINRYRRRLKMPFVTHNSNRKVQVFTNHVFDTTIVSNTDQQLIVKMVNQSSAYTFFVTMVYASCDNNMRMDLWEEFFSLSNEMHDPQLQEQISMLFWRGKRKLGAYLSLKKMLMISYHVQSPVTCHKFHSKEVHSLGGMEGLEIILFLKD